MPRSLAPAPLLAVLLAALAACSPTLDWRELRAEPADLQVMLPCKPDKGARRVPLAGPEVELQVLGCEAGGATFAVLQADVGDPVRAAQALVQWNQATLANLKAGSPRATHFVPTGALDLPGSQRVAAEGRRPDGSTVQGEAAYFARGTRVFQAVVYADRVTPAMAQPFFEGLKFR